MTLRTVMLSIQALLSAAEPDDPQDAVVAKQVCPTSIAMAVHCLTSRPLCSTKKTLICSRERLLIGRARTLEVRRAIFAETHTSLTFLYLQQFPLPTRKSRR